MSSHKIRVLKSIVLCCAKARISKNRIQKRRIVKAVIGLTVDSCTVKRSSPFSWTKMYLQKRSKLSCYNTIQSELKIQDPMCFKTYLRMSPSTFEELLTLVGPDIQKQDTQLREAIPANERLALTLRFLVTGNLKHCSYWANWF